VVRIACFASAGVGAGIAVLSSHAIGTCIC